MHACTHTSIHTYKHTHTTHTHTHIHIHKYMHAYKHTYMHTYIHICIQTYIHTNIHTHTSYIIQTPTDLDVLPRPEGSRLSLPTHRAHKHISNLAGTVCGRQVEGVCVGRKGRGEEGREISIKYAHTFFHTWTRFDGQIAMIKRQRVCVSESVSQ